MTQNQYEVLVKRSRSEFKKLARLTSYSDVSEPLDLVSGFYVSGRYEDGMATSLMLFRFGQYCARVYRDAVRRRDAGKIVNNSQNYVVDNFDGNYRDDDLIDAYVHRKSLGERGLTANLSDAPYRGASGKIDYDAMLEDMQKTMCENDRLFLVQNHRNGRQYTCGDVMAIPLEMLYNHLSISKADAKRMGLNSTNA